MAEGMEGVVKEAPQQNGEGEVEQSGDEKTISGASAGSHVRLEAIQQSH